MGRPKLPPEDPLSPEVQARFWARVRKTTRCWLWIGNTNGAKGYGIFYVRHAQNRRWYAHTYSFLLHYGTLPEGELRHTCDRPLCVRPSHLIPGTRSDNMQDAVRRKRFKNRNPSRCPRGHPYEGDNLYTHPTTGSRICITCRREAQRRWKEKHGV